MSMIEDLKMVQSELQKLFGGQSHGSNVFNKLTAIIEQMEKAEPVAWGIGACECDLNGWIPTKAYKEGEFTTPLFTPPAPTPDEITKLREQLATMTRERDEAYKTVDDNWVSHQQLAATQAEVEVLRGQLEESRANDRTGMRYLSQVRAMVGGYDFPDMVRQVEALLYKLYEAESDQLSWLTYRHVVNRVEDLEREAVELRKVISKLIDAVPGHAGQCSGLKCREPYCYSCNDEDDANAYLQGVWNLCAEAKQLLASPIDAAMQPTADEAGKGE